MGAAADTAAQPQKTRVVVVTMDTHLASATQHAALDLARECPGVQLTMHAASEYAEDESKLKRCRQDIARADIVIVTMLFMEAHFEPVLDALTARRDHCHAMLCAMSASEVMPLTRIGEFDMSRPASGPMALLKKLRGKSAGSEGKTNKPPSGGAAQMKMLRRVPKLLRFIPGTAQDVRTYFLALQYWLGGSRENMTNLVRMLLHRYVPKTERATALNGLGAAEPPIEYPDVGVYHPCMSGRIADHRGALPTQANSGGTVGVLLLRSYLLGGNAAHYDGVIAALEAQGLTVVPAFAAGLDARPAIEQFFMQDEQPAVDAIVSLTGFSLVGGPAYNDSEAAVQTLLGLDVPYLAAHPVEFQTLEQWGGSTRGLSPVESTIMIAIPELDGATGPTVFGGRAGAPGTTCGGCERACEFTHDNNPQDMHSCPERAQTLAMRVARQVALRRQSRRERKVAIVLFNFPPNAGNAGTAAFLDVFGSLFNTLTQMREGGYDVGELPDSTDALRDMILTGNAAAHGADANVHALISADEHVRRERWLKEIEAQWGAAPGRAQVHGQSILVLGQQFGNVLVAVQPGFGYEGDPMRLLFEQGLAPTHAFSAFYRYLREDFGADAVLHFGTHGALEFMPGKQSGMSGGCWPERLIGDLPNFYLYAANNPSEGAIAKRRGAATLVSYMTPSVTEAGLYRELQDLHDTVERWRGRDAAADVDMELALLIQAQAAALELTPATPEWTPDECDGLIRKVADSLHELECTLIPHGMHVVGEAMTEPERIDLLASMVSAETGQPADMELVTDLVKGTLSAARMKRWRAANDAHAGFIDTLQTIDSQLQENPEADALLQALDGRFIAPAPGGDVLRTPEVLPTGRNLHGFDPFRIPSAYAVADGQRQAQRLLRCHQDSDGVLPESVAMVLWGTDNLKSEGGPIAQALALLGAQPRFDSYGRVAGATLVPLSELGRPRIDVVMTLSGIFRDLMPLQIKLLAEAALLAASADEPIEENFVRKHALAYQQQHDCTLEEAALRVYGNDAGAYGANVNHLIESGRWQDEDELAETYSRRKGFAYGCDGQPRQKPALLESVLADVTLTYQNLDSVELGVTTVDNYFDTLGGITGAVKRARRGDAPPVYIGDQTRGDGAVRTLAEQVALETRTRMLNPKWHEGILAHGYEGVRQIEVHMTNTMGWSATTGQVQPWVYQKLTETFLLDPEMRDRLAALNPTASSRFANRLLEASDRDFWQPDDETLAALEAASEALEDAVEGIAMASAQQTG
ncbi:MAG: magnesium chelatase subunit H [Pseudomonadota bacterium]